MAALNLNANLPVYIQWPDDAALTLIQRRRAYQPLFTTMRLHDQKQLWRGIARDIRNNHTFRPTKKQCREKWNALKAGYENLERLINRNPDDYPTLLAVLPFSKVLPVSASNLTTRTPSLHDERFHQELSDEFWRVELRSSRINRVDRRTYEYRERRRFRRSRSRSPYHHRERGRSHSRSLYYRERGRSHSRSHRHRHH
ncbi:hypothetical protein GLOIN_2v1789989 [Rhizophagus irregularis DAOM 181602=DAOM 197198]|nr:hypothetical protein GLOIN_2v1789989 [Rhizophagus irregularis DAOM 181602=DAOM 197198]